MHSENPGGFTLQGGHPVGWWEKWGFLAGNIIENGGADGKIIYKWWDFQLQGGYKHQL